MNTLQDQMSFAINLCHPLGCRSAPGQEDDASSPGASDDIDDLLREFFPAVVGVAVGFMRSHG